MIQSFTFRSSCIANMANLPKNKSFKIFLISLGLQYWKCIIEGTLIEM